MTVASIRACSNCWFRCTEKHLSMNEMLTNSYEYNSPISSKFFHFLKMKAFNRQQLIGLIPDRVIG